MSSQIVFLGIRHDVSELMQMSDAFLFPSYLVTKNYDRTELAHQVEMAGYGIETTVAQMSAIYNS